MSKDLVKATVQVGDKTITFEGPSDFVERQVEKFSAGNVERIPSSAVPMDDEFSVPGLTERDAIGTKQPRGHSETVAVLAFCLTESGKSEFNEDDIRRAYIRAGVRPPKVVGQALRDAKKNFDFIAAGSKRGMYRLSPHGDRTVRFDLPRKQRATA